MAEPYIKLYRKMLDWEWYDDINTKVLFLHCLLKANWKPTSWHGQTIEAGQFITSLATLAEETCLSISQVRTALDHLISTGEVASKSQSKNRIITINNWVEYQAVDKQPRKQVASKSQAGRKQIATDKEYKEREELKELKNNIRDYFPNDEKLDDAFQEFVKMRKQLKKPMGDHAIDLAIKKLNDLSGGDNDKAIKIINQSIMGSWLTFYELKEDKQKHERNIIDEWRNA